MDNSKQKQTELDFSNELGNILLNIYTGRLLYDYPIYSIGNGNYKIDISLVYNSLYKNSDFNNAKIGINNKWNLNIQEYIFPYDTNYKLDEFTVDDYVYISSTSEIHRFVKYCDSIIDGNRVFEYYDASGSGLKLLITPTNYKIIDEFNNTLTFDSNKRLESISSGVNPNIKKVITYDENNHISSIYDERKLTRKIIFNYENDNLISVSNKEKKQEVILEYNENNDLI